MEGSFYYYFPSKFGKNSVIEGTYVIMNNTTSKARKIWKTYLNVFSNGTFAILLPINKLMPNGGVTKPKLKFKQTIIPKWIGSIPNGRTIGNNNGTKINTAATVSINIPTMSRKILINSKIINGFVVQLEIASAKN